MTLDGARAHDRLRAGAVAIVFLVLSAWICVEALQVPVGSLRMPGAGFFPLVLGITLGVLSLLLLAMDVASHGAPPRVWPQRREVIYLMGTMAVVVALFERAGFLLAMALFLAAALRVLGKLRWITAVVVAVVGSVTTYVVFGRVLLIALPSGILPY